MLGLWQELKLERKRQGFAATRAKLQVQLVNEDDDLDLDLNEEIDERRVLHAITYSDEAQTHAAACSYSDEAQTHAAACCGLCSAARLRVSPLQRLAACSRRGWRSACAYSTGTSTTATARSGSSMTKPGQSC